MTQNQPGKKPAGVPAAPNPLSEGFAAKKRDFIQDSVNDAVGAVASKAADAQAVADVVADDAFNLLVREDGKFAAAVRWFGCWLTLCGVGTLITLAGSAAMVFGYGADMFELMGITNTTLTMALFVASMVVSGAMAAVMLVLGWMLRKSKRRNAAIWSRVLMWLQVVGLVLSYMLAGFSSGTIVTFVEIVVLVIFSVALDPALVAERRAERRAERAAELEQDRQAAAQGMLGRDLTGKGYIRTNFFNLFWMFFACCVLGLILEIIWHMTVVDPGHYEDRAGLLIGPFSPIYGFGAVLVTLALNRLYNKNPVITFVIAGLVGGCFEWATAFFMKASFGVTAWDYSSYTILGVPDPVAVFTGGQTATMFLCMWGVLGLVWVKLILPVMLKGINVIPWRLRYGLTAVVAVLMMADGLLTLGSLNCWFERASGIEPTTPIEQFFEDEFPDSFMEHRFQSMTMNVDDSTRMDTAQKAEVAAIIG